MMENYCAFSKNHRCLKYEDYEISRYALAEAESLCHGNWIEIQNQYEYIKLLQTRDLMTMTFHIQMGHN